MAQIIMIMISTTLARRDMCRKKNLCSSPNLHGNGQLGEPMFGTKRAILKRENWVSLRPSAKFMLIPFSVKMMHFLGHETWARSMSVKGEVKMSVDSTWPDRTYMVLQMKFGAFGLDHLDKAAIHHDGISCDI